MKATRRLLFTAMAVMFVSTAFPANVQAETEQTFRKHEAFFKARCSGKDTPAFSPYSPPADPWKTNNKERQQRLCKEYQSYRNSLSQDERKQAETQAELTDPLSPIAKKCAEGKDINKVSGKKAQTDCVAKQVESKDKTGDNIDPVSGDEVKDTSVLGYIDSAYKWAAVIGGLLAVLMLTYAGYRYMTSYGDPEKIADAKNLIEQALIGLALLILAAVILQTINPNTLGCKTNCGDIDFSQPSGEFKKDDK